MTNPLVLIIEDDEKLAHIFSLALKVIKCDIEVAQDGEIALARLAATTPALVVLDLHLPYVSGIEILHRIRADQRLAKTRVIIVSADLFRAEALQGEADAVLIKPISINQLRELAARLCAPDPIE